MHIAYGKGARTFERHIDIDADGVAVAQYSSLPEQVDTWFKACQRAREFCGNAQTSRLVPLDRETARLEMGATPTPGVPAHWHVPSTARALDELGLAQTVLIDEAIARTTQWLTERGGYVSFGTTRSATP